jgi:hypothetical protein
MVLPKLWLEVLPFLVLVEAVLVLIPAGENPWPDGFYRGYCLRYFVPSGPLIGLWIVA